MKRGLVILIFVIGLCSIRGFAQTADTTTSTEPAKLDQQNKQKAKDLYMQGQQLYDAGNYLGAIKLFKQSYKLYSHPNLLYNIAKAYEKAAKYEDAAKYYRMYLKRYKEFFGKEAPEKADILKTLQVLKIKAYEALPLVTINSEPSGADIYIDNNKALLGQTPFKTHLKPGVHKLWLKKRGYEVLQTEFMVGKTNLSLNFGLKEAQNFGFLRFHSNIDGAQIFVDGKVVGITPYNTKYPIEPGRHQVSFAKEGYNRVSKVVFVVASKTRTVNATMYLLNPGFSWRGYIGITSIVLGAGLITFSALYWRDIANDYYVGTHYYKEFRNYTYIGYAGGGALVGTGVGLLIWEFTRKDTGSKTASLQIYPVLEGGMGVNVGF